VAGNRIQRNKIVLIKTRYTLCAHCNVIIINSVLTLQVSTASLPHDPEPCEIKVVSNHTCSLHTCVCAGSRRVRVRLSGFRWQGISSTQFMGVSSSALFWSGSVPNNPHFKVYLHQLLLVHEAKYIGLLFFVVNPFFHLAKVLFYNSSFQLSATVP
jgi:hypothetical protein